MELEIIDNVNKPSHYQGRYGMESIDALRNFMTPEQLKGFYLGNALKYQLRFQKKNGLEDLKKARKNLDWLIEEFEVEKMKSKKIGIIIGALFVIIASPFVVQFGWNEIVTTIVPVGKISVWQALGLDALLSFIFPFVSSKKESYEDYSRSVTSSISKIVTCALLIWIASLFI